MPIKFRCQHCQQLLGIARRKAGAMVRCPTCQTDVPVPQEESPEFAAPPTERAPAAPPSPPALFERDDFDDLLRAGMSIEAKQRANAARTAAPPPPRPQPAAPVLPSIPTENPNVTAVTPITGVILSPTLATVLTVGAILLLAIAFAAGLIVGRYVL